GSGGERVATLLVALGMNLERAPFGGERSHLPVLVGALRLSRTHVALPLEDDPLLDDEARRGDVPEELAWGLDLEALASGDVAGDTTLDDDRVADDLRVHDRALSDGQRILGCDLTLDLTFDAHGPLEGQLADHTASLPQEGIAAAAARVLGHDTTP